MAPGTAIVREEPIVAISRVAASLLRTPAEEQEAVASGFHAECVQCGIGLGGDDLLKLAAPTDGVAADPRIQRLRLGYCARNGCDSHFYRLSLTPVPGVDWFALLAGTSGPAAEEKEPIEDPATAMRRVEFLARVKQLGARALLALALVGVLLAFRHWRRGGTIPLVREPENFVVDPWPATNIALPR